MTQQGESDDADTSWKKKKNGRQSKCEKQKKNILSKVAHKSDMYM